MRNFILGAAAAAAVFATVAPAAACIQTVTGCEPRVYPGEAPPPYGYADRVFIDPAAARYYDHTTYTWPAAVYGYRPYGYYGGYAGFDRLPESVRVPALPTQYYHVNQGPVFDGPGRFAPQPVYRETAIRGGYIGPYYDGGPYADPLNHRIYGPIAASGPVVYRYGYRNGRIMTRPTTYRVSTRAGMASRAEARGVMDLTRERPAQR